MGEPLRSIHRLLRALPGELPLMQNAGQCTPERIKADEEMLASIVHMTEGGREGDVIR